MARRTLCLGVVLATQAGCPATPHTAVPTPLASPHARERDGQTARTQVSADPASLSWTRVPAVLPHPVSNNAVAATTIDGAPALVSMMGLTRGKTHADIVRSVFAWSVATPDVSTGTAVPGPRGRLASAAVSVGADVWLFGGYTVAPDGHEVSAPGIDIYDPQRDTWSSGPQMPIPVDDAVVAPWRDRIALISGWSNTDNVATVQWLRTDPPRWSMATPVPGPPVFGHAGGIVGDTIVYCDGVAVVPDATPKFQAVDGCFVGAIDPAHPESIAWAAIGSHPGAARYRMGSGVDRQRGWVVFVGGTARAYNYDGVGYDGTAAEAVTDTFAYDGDDFVELPPLPQPVMDLRGVVAIDDALYIAGGLDADRQPSDAIWRLGPTR